MNKKRNDLLIRIADKALRTCSSTLFINDQHKDIQDSYNGQVAALGVSIAMTGVMATLAIYYNDKPNETTPIKANRRTVLTIIAEMIKEDSNLDLDGMKDNSFDSAKNLFEYSLLLNEVGLKKLGKEIIECSIALKQVVRTYNLVKS